jgi:hypothetical protein
MPRDNSVVSADVMAEHTMKNGFSCCFFLLISANESAKQIGPIYIIEAMK